MSTTVEEAKETGRVEAFSDGVFAIAITLLVLEIPITHPPQGEHLSEFVLKQGPNFVAYFVSFITILVMWLNHHSIFQMVRRIDRLFLVLNGFLLLLVTFINYPTALVANFVGSAAVDDARFATAFYSATFVVIALTFNLLWLRASGGRRLIGKHIPQEQVQRVTRQYRFGSLFYLATLALAFVNPWASVALNGALALYFAFTGQIERQA